MDEPAEERSSQECSESSQVLCVRFVSTGAGLCKVMPLKRVHWLGLRACVSTCVSLEGPSVRLAASRGAGDLLPSGYPGEHLFLPHLAS